MVHILAVPEENTCLFGAQAALTHYLKDAAREGATDARESRRVRDTQPGSRKEVVV